MRRIRVIIICAVCILAVFAAPRAVEAVGGTPPVVDGAGLLSADELAELSDRAAAISAEHRCSVTIVTAGSMPGRGVRGAYERADSLYKEYGYGYGDDASGVILFLSMAERDYYLEPYGFAKTAFTERARNVLLDDNVLPRLGDNDWYGAFSAYLDMSDEILKTAREGGRFSTSADIGDFDEDFAVKLAVGVLAPPLLALIVVSYWKSQMKTARRARTADNYIPEGGFTLTGQQDMFLYRTRTRVKVESESSRSSSRGGSAGGSSGRGGKF